jgi:hypothetical protein
MNKLQINAIIIALILIFGLLIYYLSIRAGLT